MASVTFAFEIWNAGARATGLAPTITVLKKLSDNTNVSPIPTISEVGVGMYKFSYDAEEYGEAAAQIDAGAAITAEADRYINMILTIDSSRTLDTVAASGTVGAAAAAAATSITLPASLNVHPGQILYFRAGSGAGSGAVVDTYTSGTGVTTLVEPLSVAIDTTTKFWALPGAPGSQLPILGTDNKVMVSNDAHTSQVTVAAVSGAVGSVTSFGSLVADIWAAAARTLTGTTAANLTQINGDTAAAANLSKSALGIVTGAAAAGTLTTTQMTTDLTEATSDHYNGRVIVWVTGALAGQATSISDYDGATKMVTFVATTEAPLAGDQFVIV